MSACETFKAYASSRTCQRSTTPAKKSLYHLSPLADLSVSLLPFKKIISITTVQCH